jgi:serine/threonine protein kinase
MSEYRKLLTDYQLLKAINMTLLEKYQPTRKEHKEVQTTSKFEISGVTQFRKFNSNTEIAWREIQLESQINEGGYGVIYRARWREILVVVKKFKIENGDVSLRDFLSECHAMEAVRHPNIVMFLGVSSSRPRR